MRRCSGCGGMLVFDVEHQKLKCTRCDSMYDVGDSSVEDDCVLQTMRCPSCGADIVTVDDEFSGFCQYCGGQYELENVCKNGEKVDEIVPFYVTKGQARNLYKKFVKNTIFLPKGYCNDEGMESMRGIYIPYWDYTSDVHDDALVKYSTSYTDGDYTVTEHYNAKGKLDAVYPDIVYNASEVFPNDMGERLKPYNLVNKVAYNSDYMAGFYADGIINLESVGRASAYNESGKILKECVKRDTGADKVESINGVSHILSRKSLFLPVWFLSYRYGNRIAYASVNGSTGDVVADLPVDKKKVCLCAGIISVLCFFFLMLFSTMHVDALMSCTSVCACMAGTAHLMSILLSDSRKSRNIAENWDMLILLVVILFGICMAPLVSWVGMIILSIITDRNITDRRNLDMIDIKEESSLRMCPAVIALVLSVLCWMIKWASPAVDFWYYIPAVVVAVAVAADIIVIVGRYNKLATHRLPHYDRTGGDNSAY